MLLFTTFIITINIVFDACVLVQWTRSFVLVLFFKLTHAKCTIIHRHMTHIWKKERERRTSRIYEVLICSSEWHMECDHRPIWSVIHSFETYLDDDFNRVHSHTSRIWNAPLYNGILIYKYVLGHVKSIHGC